MNVVTCKSLTPPGTGCEDALSGPRAPDPYWPSTLPSPPLHELKLEERVMQDNQRGPGQTQGESPGYWAQEA